MKYYYKHCIIVSAILLLCGCGIEPDPVPEPPKPTPAASVQAKSAKEPAKQPAPATPVQTESPAQPAEQSVPLRPKKVKAATQAFFDAALNGDIQTVEAELATGVYVNATSLNGQNQTALMMAAYNGHAKLVGMLIDRGGKVNHLDSTGRTALMYCCSGPFPETVKLLITKGANINIIDTSEKWTALMFAAAEGLAPNVKLLLDNGADTTPKDIDGDTAASFAANNGHTAVAKMIEEYTKTMELKHQ